MSTRNDKAASADPIAIEAADAAGPAPAEGDGGPRDGHPLEDALAAEEGLAVALEVVASDEGAQDEAAGEALLELVLAEHAARAAAAAPPPERIDGVVIGRLVALEAGEPKVELPGAAPGAAVAARSMAALGESDVGREVALMFEAGDPARPVVMGRMHRPGAAPRASVDGERLELSAEKEIVLRCGKASITLTRAGKILIRGAYLLSRSSGVHRIQGGSVQIN